MTIPGGGVSRVNTRSAVWRTLATPPPATKYGSRRAAVVGMWIRALLVKMTARPRGFSKRGPGKIAMLEKIAPSSDWSSVNELDDVWIVAPGKSDFSVGTAVASIS